MATYKKFLVKIINDDGGVVGGPIDTYEKYHIVCKEMSFAYRTKFKEPAKRDWPDLDGEDVYFPKGGLKQEAFDLEAKFMYVGQAYDKEVGENTASEMRTNITNFIGFLTGNITGHRCLSFFDEYTGVGYNKVYVKEVKNELYEYNDVNLNAYSLFTVVFRITSPNSLAASSNFTT